MSFHSIPADQEDFILAIPSFNWFTNTFQFIDTIKNMTCESMTCLHKEDQPQSRNNLTTTLQNIQNQLNSDVAQKSTKKGCNCSKTNCLKRYCECYNAGKECTAQCACYGCLNDHNHASHRIKEKEEKNGKVKSTGCTCKKSQCQKKYCQCFNAGVSCTDSCRCIGCENHGSKCDSHGRYGRPKVNIETNIRKISLMQNVRNLSNV